MNKFLRILRDDNATPPAGGAPTPPPPSIPKSKDDWDKLFDSDPTRWRDLTQQRMDQSTRELRETKEKYGQLENKFKNVETEFNNLRTQVPPPPSAGELPTGEYSSTNLPKTKEEWDELFISDPTLAHDLRDEQREQNRIQRDQQVKHQNEFETEHKKHRSELQSLHPDMYVAEKNTDGTIKMDAEGKPVLKIDQKTGEPIFDATSEKGKLFSEIYNEDPQSFASSKRGPRLIRLELERKLREKGEATIPQAGQPAGTQADQRGTMPGGVTPPVVSGKVSFTSDEEKAHAQKAVERGIYKNLSEYCSLRDGKNVGIVEENRFPKFNK